MGARPTRHPSRFQFVPVCGKLEQTGTLKFLSALLVCRVHSQSDGRRSALAPPSSYSLSVNGKCPAWSILRPSFFIQHFRECRSAVVGKVETIGEHEPPLNTEVHIAANGDESAFRHAAFSPSAPASSFPAIRDPCQLLPPLPQRGQGILGLEMIEDDQLAASVLGQD